MRRDELISQFLSNAGIAAAGTRRVASGEEMKRALSEILPGDATVYCPGATEREKEAVDMLTSRTEDYTAASVTVEEVHGGIAETGSIICRSDKGTPVQAGLLPSHHVAILPVEKIFPTLDDFFASCAETLPTNITLITGPSRTADIELTLAIGVHGPEKLDIIIL